MTTSVQTADESQATSMVAETSQAAALTAEQVQGPAVDNTAETAPEGNQEVTQTNFPVILIFSKWSLSKISSILAKYHPNGSNPGLVKIVYDRDGAETDRNIALVTDETYEALCNQGFNQRQYGKGMIISKFMLQNNHFPPPDRTRNLFVKVPEIFKYPYVMSVLNNSLASYAGWGIIPTDSWNINILLKSRGADDVRGGAFISFKRDVSLESIVMVRILLNENYWPFDHFSKDYKPDSQPAIMLKCFWARQRKRGENNHESHEENQETDNPHETKSHDKSGSYDKTGAFWARMRRRTENKSHESYEENQETDKSGSLKSGSFSKKPFYKHEKSESSNGGSFDKSSKKTFYKKSSQLANVEQPTLKQDE